MSVYAKWKRANGESESIYLVENGTITGLTDYGKICSILDIPKTIDGEAITAIGDGAFYDCSSLTSITFSGTKAQWNAILKHYNWNYNTGSYTVHCSDGDI